MAQCGSSLLVGMCFQNPTVVAMINKYVFIRLKWAMHMPHDDMIYVAQVVSHVMHIIL